MKYARFSDKNVVAETIDFSPVGSFTEEIAAQFLSVPDGTTSGMWLDESGVWHEHYIPSAEEVAEQTRQQLERQKAEYVNAVQQRLDEFARTRNYDSIFTACTYATSTAAKFRSEGQYCVTARDKTWSKCYEILAAVESNGRAAPTLAELLAELPALAWPDTTNNTGA